MFNYKIFTKIYYALTLLILIITVGTVGFMMIEGWEFHDAFHMTVITVSTVGFQEVNELSIKGQYFTDFLIIGSFGTFAYALSAITTYLVGGEYRKYISDYRGLKRIAKMDGHIIVCGFGRVGSQAAFDLLAHNRQVLIIESDEKAIEDMPENMEYLIGNATDDAVLQRAGIDKAKAIISTLPKDADNLFVVLTAREMKKNLKIISRSSKQSSVRKLKIAGADSVILPDVLGGSHMASLVAAPDVIEFLENISVQGNSMVNLEEISFYELPPDFRYNTIGELNSKKLTGCNIIGYKTGKGEYIINPEPEAKVEPNSKLFVLGNPDQIQALNRLLGIHHE